MGSKGGGGGGQQMSYSATRSMPDPFAAAQYYTTLQRAANVASTPFEAYNKPLVAEFSPFQQQSFQQTQGLQGYSQPYIDTATGQTLGSMASMGPENYGQTVQQYMNPYQQNVVGTTLDWMNNQNAQQQNELQSNIIRAGGMGGDRGAISRAALQGQQNLTRDKTIAELMQQGYSNAQSQALANANFQMSGANQVANLGQQGLQNRMAETGMLNNAGKEQQALEQQKLGTAYQQWQLEKQFPYAQTQWLAGIQQGIGPLLGGTTQGYSSSPEQKTNSGGQLAGGLLSGIGLLGKMFAMNEGGRIPYADGGLLDVPDDGGDVAPPAQGGLFGLPVAPLSPVKPEFPEVKFKSEGGRIGFAEGGGQFTGGLYGLPVAPIQASRPEFPDIKFLGPTERRKSQFDASKAGKALSDLFKRGKVLVSAEAPTGEGQQPQREPEGPPMKQELPPITIGPRSGPPMPEAPAETFSLGGIEKIWAHPEWRSDRVDLGGQRLPSVSPGLTAGDIPIMARPGNQNLGRNVGPMQFSEAPANVYSGLGSMAQKSYSDLGSWLGSIVGADPYQGIRPEDRADGGRVGFADGGVDIDRWLAAIRQIESGGRYGITGPKSRTGDIPYGAYQVMGANIPSWGKAAGFDNLTPQKFLADKSIQDAVAKVQGLNYIKKEGGDPRLAAANWIGGPGWRKHQSATDVLGTNAPKYMQMFAKAYGAPSGNTQFASNTPTPPQRPNDLGGAPLPPTRPGDITNIQDAGISAPPPTPSISDSLMALGESVSDMDFAARGGRIHFAEGGLGEAPADDDGIDWPEPLRAIGNGLSGLFSPSQAQAAPAAPAAPVAQTASSAQDSGPDIWGGLLSAGLGMLASGAPTLGEAIGQGGLAGLSAMGAEQEARAAENDPYKAAQVQNIMSQIEERKLEMAQKQAAAESAREWDRRRAAGATGSVSVAPSGASATAAGAPVQTAAAAPVNSAIDNLMAQREALINDPGYTPAQIKSTELRIAAIDAHLKDERERQNKMLEASNQVEVKKQEAENKQYADAYSGLKKSDEIAKQTKATLDQMEELMSNKNFYSGVGAEQFNTVKKLGSAIGLVDPEAATPTDLFKSLSNKLVLDAQNGSLGSGVSNADVAFIKARMPNVDLTPDANRKLIGLQRRVVDRQHEVFKMANEYAQTHGGLDAGWDSYISDWAEKHPLLTDADKKSLGGGSGSSGGQTAINPKTGERVIFRNGKWEPM